MSYIHGDCRYLYKIWFACVCVCGNHYVIVKHVYVHITKIIYPEIHKYVLKPHYSKNIEKRIRTKINFHNKFDNTVCFYVIYTHTFSALKLFDYMNHLTIVYLRSDSNSGDDSNILIMYMFAEVNIVIRNIVLMYVTILISTGHLCVYVKVEHESRGNRYFPSQLLLVHSWIIDIGQSCLLHSTHNNDSLCLIMVMYKVHNSNEIEHVIYYFMKDNLICGLVLHLISDFFFGSTFKHKHANSKCNVIIINMIFSIYMYLVQKVINQLMAIIYVYLSNIIMCRNVYVLQFAYMYNCYLLIMFASTCSRSELLLFMFKLNSTMLIRSIYYYSASTCNSILSQCIEIIACSVYATCKVQVRSHYWSKGNSQGGGDSVYSLHRWVYLKYTDYG